jgi:hypothetical protein
LITKMTIQTSAALRCAAFLAALLLAPAAFAGGGFPKGEAAFTAWMAKRIQAQLPDTRVEVDSPLTLKLRQADGEEILQANLDRIFDFCTRAPAHCEDAASQYTSGIAEHLAGREDALEAPMVRVAIRPREYLESAQKQMPADAPRILARPLTGELMEVAVVDFPTSIRLFTAADAKALKLTEKAVFELGRNNLRATLKPLGEYPQPTADASFRYLGDSPYESSRLALHSEWKAIARMLGGELIVAAPSADLLFYGRGGSPTAVGALRTMARKAAGESERPLSTSVFKWTEKGWKEVR